jgi:excinuclease ABC subunit A
MPASDIIIKGAREHNLRDVDLVLPRNKLICLTGVSGSGKSSLAFDTLYAEGQRRYIESLSSYARQFLGQMPKPDVDFIGGLSPSISISQKSAGKNPRSTVGTITEIYDYLRVLYARVGQGFCPECDRPITAQTREQIIERILQQPAKTKFLVMAPLIRGQKGEYKDLFEDLLKQGFVRARVDGDVVSLNDDLQLDRQMRHHIEVVVDRLEIAGDVRARLAEAVELALKLGEGNLIVQVVNDKSEGGSAEPKAKKSRAKKRRVDGDIIFSVDYACTDCGISFAPPSPQLFSFNSPQGMCHECDGLGEAFSFDSDLLIPDPSLSLAKGCIELIGTLSKMGRYRRSIFKGVAETIERRHKLPAGTMLDTPWKDLRPKFRKLWLWGTGEDHITYTWRGGASPIKYGGTFDGVIPDLLDKYRSSKNRMQLLKLEQYMRAMECPDCHGQRLQPQSRAVRLTSGHPDFKDKEQQSLPDVCRLSVADAANFFSKLELEPTHAVIAAEAIKEICGRLGFLMNVGLDYLSLDRTAPTLSGGESQRIRLAGQIGCGLVGVLYILDEPSIGLHPRDNDRLLETLQQLRDIGNTVVVVEHDEDTMRDADHIIDFGPGPGVRGGEVVVEGTLADVKKSKRSVTGNYLSGKQKIEVPKVRRPRGDHSLKILGAKHNNLKDVDFEIPLGQFVCVTGVSGSGKSSLVNDIVLESLRIELMNGKGDPGEHKKIEGIEHLDKLIAIDQSPIGRTPRSNPGTYIKVFDDIRKLFTKLPESKRRGYLPGRFSFNVSGGRCEACDGNGSNKLEMDFLADVWVTCPVCEGHRFNRETLGVKFKGHSIADVLEMDVHEALDLFENIPQVHHKLTTLRDVGLDYLKLGQPSPTLSGGEAQRIKLARELVKKSTGKTLYLLDEPTTGLHFADIQLLLKVLHNFVEAGNTVLVVEHNLDVIKTADWVIDLGPEGGAGGGELLIAGTPEEIVKHPASHTGKSLKPFLTGDNLANNAAEKRAKKKPIELATHIRVDGAQQHNLKHVNALIPRDKMTVFCGPSGSGKSSLAMDTIYAEGQRRYVESLSSYARQFVSQMQKPELEHIDGLSPAIAIEQQNLGKSPRSTVGTTTEIYDYLRILMARAGTPHCPDCDRPIGTQTADQIIDKVMACEEGSRVYLMAPLAVEVGEQYEALWEELRATGYVRIRVDGHTYSLDEPPTIDRRRKHKVEAIVDRAIVKPDEQSRIAESIEATLALGRGVMHVAFASKDVPEPEWRTDVHSQHLACEDCGRSFEPLTPHSFSFNSHLGWCEDCEGLGMQTGANPAALLQDSSATLADGALLLWPNLDSNISRLMLESLSARTGIPLDKPYDTLPARQRRQIMHGTGERWFDVMSPGSETLMFRFQFKGMYPALDEAARLVPQLRGRLNALVDEVECSACGGGRLRDDAAATRFRDLTIDDLCRMPLSQVQKVIAKWKLTAREKRIAGELVREVKNRVEFLNDVGLEYLSLHRTAGSLSGGEAQRIRLASQLGSALCGVLYVLDEPTIGLHPRDNARLLKALHNLRDIGNTLVLVEHDHDVIAGADMVFDFGPEAGRHGGQIVAEGAPEVLGKKRDSVTGPFISGKKSLPIPSNRRPVETVEVNSQANSKTTVKETAKTIAKTIAKTKGPKKRKKPGELSYPPVDWLTVRGARHHNLKNVDVAIPLGRIVAVTGPSGSGKSSLINDVLYASLAAKLHRARLTPGAHDGIDGVEHINKVIRVDQQPLGNSPASNPATYTGVFDYIRKLFAQLPEAKLRGYTPRRFSFNVPGGRCEDCEGDGQVCIEMHFLPDVWVTCDTCHGKRYNPETLDVKYHGQSIADVLEMTCGDAVKLFESIPKIRRILQTLCDVGLDYLSLGQSAPTLSGGEAQRVKLAAELSRPDTGQTLYLLDEPTTGLHFNDLAKLIDVLQRLVDLGNSVVVIEHNLDVIKAMDWVIDIGPEAGAEGGHVVAAGTPEEIVAALRAKLPAKAKVAKKTATKSKSPAKSSKSPKLPKNVSHTAIALAPVLESSPKVKRALYDPNAAKEKQAGELDISDVGLEQKMPWEVDGLNWHCKDRVGRRGEKVEWDGKILAEVIERIQKLGEFSETNFNTRTIVEIAAPKKSDGWFLHAITGEAWLLKLKFRVAKSTFKRELLQRRFPLPTLNEMDDLPIYSNDPRVRLKNLRGSAQEVEFRLHSWKEANTPEFWEFLKEAVAGFEKLTSRRAAHPDDVMPWKKLGQKWHFSTKGFPPGKRPAWKVKVLEELCELLDETASGGQFLWNNQQVVHLFVKDQKEPWASIHTKRPTDIQLALNGPKGRVTLGRVAKLARDRFVDGAHDKHDIVKLQFKNESDLAKGDLQQFLNEHLENVRQGKR